MAAEVSWEDRPDEELLVLAGEAPEAFRVLHRRYAPSLFRWASRRLDPTSAEELVQDVLISSWQKRSTFDRRRGSFQTWISSIAHHRLANELRRRGRRPESDLESPEAQLAMDGRSAPSDAAWEEYRRIAVRAALEQLPDAQRQAVGLAFLSELSHEEVARALAIPLGTAKTRIRAGLRRMAPALSGFMALMVVGLSVALHLSRERQAGMAAEERALRSVTSSDTENLHLSAEPGIPGSAHGSFRKRPSATIAVMTFSNLPADRTPYQAWARIGDRWVWLAQPVLDQSGHGLSVIEDPILTDRPAEIRVTRETHTSAAPAGQIILQWTGH